MKKWIVAGIALLACVPLIGWLFLMSVSVLFNFGGGTASCSSGSNTAPVSVSIASSQLTASQKHYAEVIIGVAKSRHLPSRDAAIAVATAGQESSFSNPLTPDVHGSLGLFQQTPADGWGTYSQVTDPVYATNAFLSALVKIHGINQMSVTEAAQAVQHSAFPDAYQKWAPLATELADQGYNSVVSANVPVQGTPPTSQCGTTTTAGTGVVGKCTVTSVAYRPEYSIAQLASIYGDPGTAASHPAMDADMTNISFLGHPALVNKKIAPCLEAVAQEIQGMHLSYHITQFGCYRFDSDNGTSNIGLASYHTYGAACDINWDQNPFDESGIPAPHNMPAQIVKAFNDHGFMWGGDWTQPKDYMHFEFHGITP